MAQIQYIKDLFENEDLSLRKISRRTNHSFNTVKKYAYQENWGEGELPNLEPESYPVLGDFIPIIDEWLEADRKVPRKQRHTMWRMFCRLRDEHGFTGSYSSVKRYVRKKKFTMRAESSGYLPIAHPQGWGQVDFGEVLYYGSDEQEHTGYDMPGWAGGFLFLFYACAPIIGGGGYLVFKWLPEKENEKIIEKQGGIRFPGELAPFSDKKYFPVEDTLRSTGFTNVTCVNLHDLNMFTALVSSDKIDKITINGKAITSGGKIYMPDVPIVITYHGR